MIILPRTHYYFYIYWNENFLNLVNDFFFQYKIKGNPSNEQVVFLFDTDGILKLR